jgi:hypothetical protein
LQLPKRLKNATVTINKDGLRTSKKFSNINKIIFYGDSVTYGGSYIDDREIFSDLVCQKLNATKELYSCGNAGVNAYGIRNITKRIKNYESKFPNHYIIITIIYGDFLRNFSQINSLPYFTKPMQNIFKATTELTLYCLDIIRNNVRFGYDKNSYKKNDEEFDTIEINESINELVNLYKISKKNNIPIKIIWSPSFQDFSINKIDYENNKIFNILKSEKYNQKNIELIKKNIHHNIKDNLISSPLRGLHFKNCLYIALQIAKLFKISKNVFNNTKKIYCKK